MDPNPAVLMHGSVLRRIRIVFMSTVPFGDLPAVDPGLGELPGGGDDEQVGPGGYLAGGILLLLNHNRGGHHKLID